MNRIPRQRPGRDRAHRRVQTMISCGLVGLLLVTLGGAVAIGRGPMVARAQASTPITATVTPETALLYVGINLDITSAQYQQAAELLQRIGLDSSIEDIAGEVSSTTTGREVLGTSELDAFLGGEAGIAVFTLGSDLTEMTDAIGSDLGGLEVTTPEALSDGAAATTSAAFIVSAPDSAAAFAAAEAELQQSATDQGVTVTEETYEGVQIKSIPADELTGETGSALAQVGDFIVLGSVPSDIEPVIDTEAGNIPAIGDADGFTTVSAELNADWIVFGYVNGGALSDQMGAMSAASGVDLSTVEVAQLQADTGFVIWADGAGFRIDSISSPAPGATIPQAANFDAELPAKVPGDTVFFVDNYDLGPSGILDAIFLSALAGLESSFGIDEATPVATPTADEQFEQLELLLGFNLKTDFIDQLVGEWGMAFWGLALDENGDFDPNSFGVLLVSDAQTPATLADAVSKLSLLLQAGFAGEANVTTRVIGQDQISVLTMDPGDGSAPMTVEFGVVEGEFIISFNDAISDYLAGVDSPLSENPTYQAALAALPAEHNSIVYMDLTQLIALAQTAMASTESSFEFEDASDKCGEYSTQAAAQEAFDADQALNWELDQDFDGEACEDFFAADEAEVATPEVSADQLSGLKAFVTVGFERDGLYGTSSLVLIEE